jgi:hypothetical protein
MALQRVHAVSPNSNYFAPAAQREVLAKFETSSGGQEWFVTDGTITRQLCRNSGTI